MYIIYSFQKIDTVIKKKNEATIHPVFLTGVLTLSHQEGPDSRSQTLSAILTFIVLGQTSCLGSAQSNSELTKSTKHKSTSVSLCLFLPPSLGLVRRLASGVKSCLPFLTIFALRI